MMTSLTLLTLLSLSSSCLGLRRKVVGCEGSEVELWCEEGTVISVIRANYGRISSSVCPDTGGHQTWSTRCIQPRTLREVTSRCSSGDSQCSLQVSSQVFGDPCPDTPKYLEVVYTCQRRSEARQRPSVPDWILKMKSLPPASASRPSSTSTVRTTERTERQQLAVVTENIQVTYELGKINFPESLPLLNEELEEKEKEAEDDWETLEEFETVYINQPKSEDSEWNLSSILEDDRILPALIIISVSLFILGVVGVYLVLHKKDSDTPSEVYTIVKLDSSHYPQYIFVPDREANLYQVRSVSSDDSCHNYYQIV